MSTTAGLVVTLIIAWAVTLAMYSHAKGLRIRNWRIVQEDEPSTPESPLFDRYQRRVREMDRHKLNVSRDWRRRVKTDGDAA